MHSLKIIHIQNKPLAPGPTLLPPPSPPGSPSMAYPDTEPSRRDSTRDGWERGEPGPPGAGGSQGRGDAPDTSHKRPSQLAKPAPVRSGGDGGGDPGERQELWGSEAGDPQNLWGDRPGGDRAGWERGTVRGHGGGDGTGMISATSASPISWPPQGALHPQICKFPGKDPSRWIPAKGEGAAP